jgi:DNA-binding MarR family transcriptional regulator
MIGDMEQETDAEIEAAIDAYAAAIRLVDPIRLAVWEDLGLTTAQLRILYALYRAPDLPLGELAQRIGVTPSTTSGLVDKLVRHDLVEREESAEDRRRVQHRLTPAGRQAAGELRRTTRDYLAQVFRRLQPAERDEVVAGLRRLCEAAEGVTPAAGQEGPQP